MRARRRAGIYEQADGGYLLDARAVVAVIYGTDDGLLIGGRPNSLIRFVRERIDAVRTTSCAALAEPGGVGDWIDSAFDIDRVNRELKAGRDIEVALRAGARSAN